MTNLTVLSPQLAGTLKIDGATRRAPRFARRSVAADIEPCPSAARRSRRSRRASRLAACPRGRARRSRRKAASRARRCSSTPRSSATPGDTFHVAVHRAEWQERAPRGRFDQRRGHDTGARESATANRTPDGSAAAPRHADRGQHRRQPRTAAGRPPYQRASTARGSEYHHRAALCQCAAHRLGAHHRALSAPRRAIA